MTNAFVLMTALPPTKGHLDLIDFASRLEVNKVIVLINTQPDEPMTLQRVYALKAAVKRLDNSFRIHIEWQNEAVQQEPTGEDDQEFWNNWVSNLRIYGFKDGDYIVASEKYGIRLAQEANGHFMPYDLDRWVRWTKGTEARSDYRRNWNQMLPEFRQFLAHSVTIFGAESTGKTTLTEALADNPYLFPATKLFEWARPYLESVGAEVTIEKMHHIAEGQYALQRSTYASAKTPLIIQDTDLYTTIGFWEDWDPDSVPNYLYEIAQDTQSDLYIILRSNIPFEHDELRYGGEERQTSDQYWIDLCKNHNLPFVVLDHANMQGRLAQSISHILPLLENPIAYQRQGAEYQS